LAQKDLREWLAAVEKFGELKRIDGADWNLEMSGISELVTREAREKPALLFDKIKGYPAGFQALFASLGTVRRTGLTLELPLPENPSGMDLVRAIRDKLANFQPIRPTLVNTGPVTENIQTGDDIDLWKFPAPFFHELDGGRYIGTGHAVITRDPDDGWVNLGSYRIMVVDKNTAAFHASAGRHGRLHRQKHFDKGETCPVAISVGHHPLMFLVSSCLDLAAGVSEYDYAGGFRGAGVEVIKGPYTGLPVPAWSEIVIEGDAVPETVLEGPFGEWSGYYANNALNPVPEPIIRVKSVMHRTNPVLSCAIPGLGDDSQVGRIAIKSALIWDHLEKAGISDIKGVWCHEAGGAQFLKIISLKQRYVGHAKQAAMIASQCRPGAYLNRYVLVVDEDIDPSNTQEVLWAMCTRSDPERDIDIIRRCWGSNADPRFAPGLDKQLHNSMAIIDACKPFEWIKDFPPVAGYSPELREKLTQKWGNVVLG